MKTRSLLFFMAVCCCFLKAIALPVDRATALDVAVKFMKTTDLQHTTTYKTVDNVPALYVFNTSDGFVIVAGDDRETPIIAYSHESRFDPNDVPVPMEAYLQDFVNRIHYGITHRMVADEATSRQWALVKATGRLNDATAAKAVAPLITTHWHQGCLYNSLCPPMESQPCGHAEVGCVAVAMGQIMNYWKFPAVGLGSHSYSPGSGTLTANFGNTTYHWESMPDALTETSSPEAIEAVATLLFHCGVSVDMYYSHNGSGAHSIDVPHALVNYFKYSREIHREKRGTDNALWLDMLKASLDSLQPLLYSGNGNGNHAFVCDGYDSNDLLHFNWGWGGNGDGYFALGNLNPSGYDFNNGNAAIFNIVPNFDPYYVVADSYPSVAGSVDGAGGYQMGDTCNLTALPAENCTFLYWKKDGEIISNSPTYTFIVRDHLELEAFFSFMHVKEVAANYDPDANDPSSPNALLSWGNHDDEEWVLLKQFEVSGETGGIAVDGQYIYVTYAPWDDPTFMMEKYTLDGALVESFNIDGLPNALGLAYDGTDFYCNCMYTPSSIYELYRIDVEHKTVLDTLNMGNWFATVTYDPEYDGFWLGQDYKVMLCDRQGNRIKTSPTVKDYIIGTGYHTSKDGYPHLLIYRRLEGYNWRSAVYDYDITSNYIFDRPLLSLAHPVFDSYGACTGKYDGKDAMFLTIGHTIKIYEIRSSFTENAQIMHYRLYRSDSEGHTVTIADEAVGSSFVDHGWNELPNGTYRYGISEVYANGNESESIWSNPLVKSNHGIGENLDPDGPTVRKVYENGQIVIIRDGKRYNILGQEIQ